MALVEVIVGKASGAQTLADSLGFVRQVRKTPIIVNDSRGFYTSRVFQTFIHEGLELLLDGTEPALIENAARHAGMPVGPLAVTDEVTLELPLQIVRQSEREDPGFVAPRSVEVLERMVKQGRLGRKSGRGFYDYDGSAKRLWPGLGALCGLAAVQPVSQQVQKRFLYIQALETARCLEENVITHPADGDIGSVLGWGYPGWTGGTLSLIETIGLASFVAECDALAQAHGARFLPPASLRDMAARGKGFDWS